MDDPNNPFYIPKSKSKREETPKKKKKSHESIDLFLIQLEKEKERKHKHHKKRVSSSSESEEEESSSPIQRKSSLDSINSEDLEKTMKKKKEPKNQTPPQTPKKESAVEKLYNEFLSKCQVPPADIKEELDITNIEELIQNRSWEKAVELCKKAIDNPVNMLQQDISLCKQYYLEGLCHLHRYDDALDYVSQLGNGFGKETYGVKIQIAITYHLAHRSENACDLLYLYLAALMNQYQVLSRQVDSIPSRDSRLRAQSAINLEEETQEAEKLTLEECQQWIETVLIELCNISLCNHDYISTLGLCEELFNYELKKSGNYNLLGISRACKICIQMGELNEAERYLEDITKHITDDQNPLILLLQGLILMGKGEYYNSISKFNTVIQQQWDPTPYSTTLRNEYIISGYINLATAYLHCADPYRSVDILENLIFKNPLVYLTEEVVDNLCVLYELVYADSKVKNMKKVLMKLCEYYQIYVNPDVFRL